MQLAHQTLDMPRPAQPPSSHPVPFTARGGFLLVALLLGACVHSPHAAMASFDSNAPATAVLAPSKGTLPVTGCREATTPHKELLNAARELQALGMALTAVCHAESGGWVMRVQVTNGVRASKVVRGPLADGHDVDMGTPSGARPAGASTSASGFSPDVMHNRQWLHSLMARHQFDNLPDAWWHFAQRSVKPADRSDTDLAAR